MRSQGIPLILSATVSVMSASAIGTIMIEPSSPGAFSITWFGEYLRPYQVEASPDLEFWMNLPPVQIGDDAMLGMLVEPGPPTPIRYFWRVREGAIRPGFDSGSLESGDDEVVSDDPEIGFDIKFAGQFWDKCWVNNNGNITFNLKSGSFHPVSLLAYSQPMIAAFWGDVDTGGIPPGFSEPVVVSFGQGLVDGSPAFGVNWVNVGYYEQQYDKLNSFQLVLIDRSVSGAVGDFDIEFNYNQIQWETGSASGGADGYGGEAPTVGLTDGGGLALEVAGSGVSLALLDTIVSYDAGSSDYIDSGVPNYPVVGTPGTGGLKYRSHASEMIPGRLVFKIRDGRYFGDLLEADAGTATHLNGPSFRVDGSATAPTGAQVTYKWTVLPGGSAIISNDDHASTYVTILQGNAAQLKLTVEVDYNGVVAQAIDTVFLWYQ